MVLRVSLIIIVLATFFIDAWSADYTMPGFLLFGFFSINAISKVLRLGNSNKEIGKIKRAIYIILFYQTNKKSP